MAAPADGDAARREEEPHPEQHPLQAGQAAVDRRAFGEGGEEQVEEEGRAARCAAAL